MADVERIAQAGDSRDHRGFLTRAAPCLRSPSKGVLVPNCAYQSGPAISFCASRSIICPFSTLEIVSEGCPRAKRGAPRTRPTCLWANHLLWHLRDGSTRSGKHDPKADNMQEVRDFAGYFAKYLGKDEQAEVAREPIPGRWWGNVNKQNIPWAEMKELELPVRMRIHCQRIARKIRQKKADAAKHFCVMRELGLVRLTGPGKGQPIFSQFFLTCGRARKGTDFGNNLRAMLGIEAKGLGRVQFPTAIKFAAVKLTGKSAVSTGKRILEYASDRFRDDLETCPF